MKWKYKYLTMIFYHPERVQKNICQPWLLFPPTTIFAACICIACIFSACSNTKYLPKGETLYTGSKIKYVSTDSSAKKQKAVLKPDLQAIILPKPNKKILGLRVQLWFYNIAGKPTGKGLRYLIKNKLGEPPVYAKDVNFEKNRAIMTNRLQNRGYFKGNVIFDTITKNKRTTALYIAKPGVQYIIDTVNFPTDSSELSAAIREVTKKSPLQRGKPYDLDVIKNERTRIDNRLKQKGYFFFNENYLLAKVDSSIGANKVNIYLQTKIIY